MQQIRRAFFVLVITLQTCFAGARHFTFLYEAPTSAPGSFESENYATSLFDQGKFTGMDFRHEIEIGITEHFQASIYLANWNYDAEERATHYESASAEFIYNLTNPVTDFAGISLYEELAGGHRFFESETKLIAQKNFGPLIFLYNLTVEAESSGEGLSEHEGEIQNAVGACYEITPRLPSARRRCRNSCYRSGAHRMRSPTFFPGPTSRGAEIAGSPPLPRSNNGPIPKAKPTTRCA